MEAFFRCLLRWILIWVLILLFCLSVGCVLYTELLANAFAEFLSSIIFSAIGGVCVILIPVWLFHGSSSHHHFDNWY